MVRLARGGAIPFAAPGTLNQRHCEVNRSIWRETLTCGYPTSLEKRAKPNRKMLFVSQSKWPDDFGSS